MLKADSNFGSESCARSYLNSLSNTDFSGSAIGVETDETRVAHPDEVTFPYWF